jgi:hypothetical protein
MREHNNDRKLRPREIIQQDDGEQYETRSYIIRNVRLLQSLKGEPTRRDVPYVCGPLIVNASRRIISERLILVLSSRLNRVLPSGRFPSYAPTNNYVPCEQTCPGIILQLRNRREDNIIRKDKQGVAGFIREIVVMINM